MNPIDSIKEWVDGVGHSDKTSLYAGLVMEEMGELLEAIQTYRREFQYGIGAADSVSYSLKNFDVEFNKTEALDAALDIAWVALCLAYTLAGDNLPKAWAELHRSNITDKQVDGVFTKNQNGKVIKPDTWTEPNFSQFLR